MTLKEAMQTLVDEYGKAVGNEHIHNPIAYALYQTWKIADGKADGKPDGKQHCVTSDAIPIKWLKKQFGKYCAVTVNGIEWANILTDVVLKAVIDQWEEEQHESSISH